jgi:hypothetical protein
VNPVVELPAGLEEVSPAELPTLRAGQEMLVAGPPVRPGQGRRRPARQRRRQEVREPLPAHPRASSARGNAFVPRLWAALTIERLELEGRGEDQARIIALSQAYAVLSRHTSLLVLESPAMFRAFGVDRGRPAVEWTGDEEADAVESVGTTDFTAKNKDAMSMRVGGSIGAGKGAAAPRATVSSVNGEDDSAREKLDLAADAPAAPVLEAAKEDKPRDRKAPCQEAGAARQLPPPRPDGRRWIQMRREWFRVGSVARFDGVHPNILDAGRARRDPAPPRAQQPRAPPRPGPGAGLRR